MSTQCGVAIKTDKGYETIYVHNDGYPDYMWPMLTENYNSKELATQLVSLGDASYIAEHMDTALPHSFNKPQWDTCCFYHRDRGEKWVDVAPTVYKTRKELSSCYYYSYVWEDGCWHFYKGGEEIY
jgi:hypothetical protein